MAASTSFLNTALDSGIAGIQGIYTGTYLALYSGNLPMPEPVAGGSSYQLISAYNVASNSTKAATARISFAPTGASNGGWGYDQLRIYGGPSTGVLLHSVTISPPQFINNLDVHQVLVTYSGQ